MKRPPLPADPATHARLQREYDRHLRRAYRATGLMGLLMLLYFIGLSLGGCTPKAYSQRERSLEQPQPSH